MIEAVVASSRGVRLSNEVEGGSQTLGYSQLEDRSKRRSHTIPLCWNSKRPLLERSLWVVRSMALLAQAKTSAMKQQRLSSLCKRAKQYLSRSRFEVRELSD